MFKINQKTKQIDLTRGDAAIFEVLAPNDDGTFYTFKVGDIVRFSVFKKKDCHCVELVKDTLVEAEGTSVTINLSSEDTKIGNIISKDTDYWYEVVLNPDTLPQTIIGYEIHPETNKPWEKILKLLPEAADNDYEGDTGVVTPESSDKLIGKITSITGLLENLNTKDKSNLVAAINEVASNGGGTSDGTGSSVTMILAEDDDATKIEKLMSVIENDMVVRPLFYRANNKVSGDDEGGTCIYKLANSFTNATGRVFVFESSVDALIVIQFTISNTNELTKNIMWLPWSQVAGVTTVAGDLTTLATEDKSNLVNAINEVNGKTVKVLTETPELNNLDAGYYILKGVDRISNGEITGISFVDGGTSDKVLVVGEFTKDNIVHKIGYIFGSKSHIGIINTYDGTSVINFNNILYKDNTEEYIPTEDYNPATKQYVDKAVAENSGGDTSFYTYTTTGELANISNVTNMGVDTLNKLISDVLGEKTTYLTLNVTDGCFLFKMEKQYNGRIRGYNTYLSRFNILHRVEIYIDYNKTTYAFTKSSTSRTDVEKYVNKSTITKTITSDTLVLNHNQDARLGELTTLILSMPASYDDFYESEFSFKSGETATTLTYSSTPLTFVGDDVDSEGSFIPEPNTLYEVSVKNLGTNGIIARVGSV